MKRLAQLYALTKGVFVSLESQPVTDGKTNERVTMQLPNTTRDRPALRSLSFGLRKRAMGQSNRRGFSPLSPNNFVSFSAKLHGLSADNCFAGLLEEYLGGRSLSG